MRPAITVAPADPTGLEARQLVDELSQVLASITGDGGRSSFDPEDVRAANARFAIARDGQGRPVGCGAFRPLQEGVAEVKRMYARPGHAGVGSAVLAYLEADAAALGYRALWLETRLVNTRAVRFYEARGYARIPNYGRYASRPEAACFEKRLV